MAQLPSVTKALDNILMICSLTNEAKSEARGLKKTILCHSMLLSSLLSGLKFCSALMTEMYICSQEKSHLKQKWTKSRQQEMQALGDRWDSLLSEATLVAAQMNVPPQFNKEHNSLRKRKRFHDETSQEQTVYDNSVSEQSVFYCTGQYHK